MCTHIHMFHSSAVCDCVCICIYVEQRWGPECEKNRRYLKAYVKNIFISAIFSPFSKFWFLVIFKSFGPWTGHTSPNTSFSSIAVCLGAHTVYGVSQSRTRLKWLSSSSNCVFWLFQLESKIVVLMCSSCLFTFFPLSFSQMLVFFLRSS